MSTPTDRERLAHFVQLIGAAPRQAEFNEAGNLIKLNLAGLGLSELPPEIGEFVSLEILILGQTFDNQDQDPHAWIKNRLSNVLTALPNEITQLSQLRILICDNNQIHSLPLNFIHLINLRYLSLRTNQLNSLPLGIAHLTGLQVLWLADNHLRSLPPSFTQLINLQRLSLADNQLSSLLPDFDKLVNLYDLSLNSNQLHSLPTNFGKLIKLKLLWLGNNLLSELPSDFTQLFNLQILSLAKNRFTYLPPDFVRLVKLQTLWLHNNQLRDLPSDFAKLVNLQTLSLSGNRFVSLPLDLLKLRNLQILYLSNNQLNHLPDDFAQLSNLTKLALNGNQFSRLPSNFTHLINLEELDLSLNPWRTPPPEIVETGLDEVMGFLHSLKTSNVTARYQAKLMIIGEGAAGKSSALRALRGLTFNEKLETTHGIDIQPYQLSHPNQPDITITLNVWDFGGQQIYHTTHQFFMTRRSLYLLVWNARGDTEQGRLDHWLRNIQILAPDAPVLLVATHIDERPADFNYERFKASYPQLVGWVGVSNKMGTGIDQLRQIIAEQAAALPLMEQQWPSSWVAVEEALQKKRRHHITAREFHEICVVHGVTRPGEEKTLAGYLHDLGKILYFQEDDALSDFVVLKPNWLTQTMARVLDDDLTRNRQGVLDHRDFGRLWPLTEAKMKYERRLYPLFQRMLERFLICYQLETHPNGHEQSLAPLLLPHAPPADLRPWPQLLPDQPEIRLCFKLDFVPPGLMSWFIVLSHHYSQGIHWREGVRLQYEQHQAEVILNPSVRELWLRVRGPAPSNFFNLLQHTLNERIIKRYFTGLSYTRQIPCNCAECQQTVVGGQSSVVTQTHFFDYDKLVKRMEDKKLHIECQHSYAMVSVPALLEGIHYTTQDRVEAKVDAALGEIRTLVLQQQPSHTSGGSMVQGNVHTGVFVGRDQINVYTIHQEPIIARLGELGQGQARILDEVIQSRQLSEQILRDTMRLWNLSSNNLSAEAPSTFLLMPGNRSRFHVRNLFDSEFTLYLLCQHPAAPHLPIGEAGYPLPANRQWWTAVAPWLAELIKYLKYLPHASGIAKAYDESFYQQIELNIEIFKTAIELAPTLDDEEDLRDFARTGELGRAFEVQGAALRALHTFLQETDPKRHWCGLRKVATNDGNLLWLCPEHARFHGI